jgi:hypothetical protein
MKKTTFICVLVLASIISVSVLASTTLASDKISAGVKKGDWIEYNISITGPPLDPIRNLTWYRNDILDVNGAAFEANMTALTVNGTYSSSVWHFNLTEGQVQGWEIIPPNLDVGDTFFDSAKSANITVEGEEQKIVAGATRNVTRGNDPGKLYKEWDKATGVYVNSVEHTKNYLVLTNATATNMWSPEIQEPNQTVFYAVVAACVVLAGVTSLVTIFARGKTRKWPTLRSPSQGKTAALTILAVVLAEVGFINFFPFYAVGLSFAQINLIMQTVWTGLVFVSLWLRTKGNYFAHEITMLIVVAAWAVGLVIVMFMDPFSSSTAVFSNTPLRLVMNGLHGIFSVPALVFGVWLVLLWRPGSTTFAPKSRRLAQVLPVFWVVSYVVGVLDFILLHTTFFG